MSAGSAASQFAGGHTRGTATTTAPPPTVPWGLSSSSLPISAECPSPTGFAPTSMRPPPSAFPWIKDCEPPPSLTTRRAPLPRRSRTAPTSPMRVAPPLPPSPRSPP
eukprot:6355739-Prymnesium_polylepis.1